MSMSIVSEAPASSVSVSTAPAFRATLERIAALRVKIKNLAQEAALIRVEENRALARPLRDSKNPKKRAKAPIVRDFSRYLRHKQHRVGTVGSVARVNQLAYGCLRGMPYARIESYTRDEPSWREIEKVVLRFAFDEYEWDSVSAFRTQRERDREAAEKAATAKAKGETQGNVPTPASQKRATLAPYLIARLAEVEAHWTAWLGAAEVHFKAMETPPARAAREAAHQEHIAKVRAMWAAHREMWRTRHANRKSIPIENVRRSVREPITFDTADSGPNGD